MNELIDIILGKMVFIGDSLAINMMFNYREFVDKQVKDDWVIAYQINYAHENKIVNKKHPKHKQIVKLINISVEHGITVRRSHLIKHGFLLFFYLFEKFIDPDIVNMKRMIRKSDDQITFEGLCSVFMLFLLILSISIIVFIIEVVYYKMYCMRQKNWHSENFK